jgi:tetratricopeptide (TPR) repeat protein
MINPDKKRTPLVTPSPYPVPYFAIPFSTPEMMSAEQAAFYADWCAGLETGIYWDIEGSLSYVFLYMYQLVAEKSFDEIIPVMLKIKEAYGEYSKIDEYCNEWIADCHIGKNQFEQALQYLPKNFNLLKNAGVKLDLAALIRLFPPTFGVTTDFGRANRDKIVAELPTIIQEYERQTGVDVVRDCTVITPDYVYTLFRGAGLDYDRSIVVRMTHYSFDRKKFWGIVPDILRQGEDRVRVKFGLPMIGEGWLGETRLFQELKATFPDCKVTHQTRLPFLGQQHLDVYIHELSVGLEYQGEQHDRPVAYFGGEGEFARTQERDARKQRLCEQNGVTLLYIYPGYYYDAVVAQILEVGRQRGIVLSVKHLKEHDRLQIQNHLDATYLREKSLLPSDQASRDGSRQELLARWLNDHKSRLREHHEKEIRASAQEMERNLASSTDPLDQHYFLERLSYWHYRYREYPGFIEKSIEYGLQDIALTQDCLDSFERGQFESLQSEYRTMFGHNPVSWSEKRMMLLHSFARVLIRLIITYEKMGQVDQAIELCRKAIEMELPDRQSKGGFLKRLANLMAAQDQQNIGSLGMP